MPATARKRDSAIHTSESAGHILIGYQLYLVHRSQRTDGASYLQTYKEKKVNPSEVTRLGKMLSARFGSSEIDHYGLIERLTETCLPIANALSSQLALRTPSAWHLSWKILYEQFSVAILSESYVTFGISGCYFGYGLYYSIQIARETQLIAYTRDMRF